MRTLILGLAALCGTAACQPEDGRPELRLGYFPNLTHAAAIVGIADTLFERELGADVVLRTNVFNAGPAAVEALFSGALDAAYIGPNPAINAYQRSKGEAIRIVAGAAAGGAALIVRPGIEGPADLRGRKLATPQLGNTQDVALRAWLRSQGLSASLEGGGDVSILPQENSQTFETFRTGAIDGAWLPEPWASRLVVEGGGRMLVDEASLWPDGRYATTVLVVRTEYLRSHPELVERLLAGHLRALERINGEPERARKLVNEHIAQITGAQLADAVLQSAWRRLTFTHDPLLGTVAGAARAAHDVGLLSSGDVTGIGEPGPLERALSRRTRLASER